MPAKDENNLSLSKIEIGQHEFILIVNLVVNGKYVKQKSKFTYLQCVSWTSVTLQKQGVFQNPVLSYTNT